MNKKYINPLEVRNKIEEIRLKDLKDMTKEDAIEALMQVINQAEYFPCGYSHTIKAIEILKRDHNEKN